MSRKRNESINRRDFVRSSTAAVVLATCLGPTKSLAAATPASPLLVVDAADIMKAAAAAILEFNKFFKKSAADVEALKQTKASLQRDECSKITGIIDAVVRVVVAVVVLVIAVVGTPFSGGGSLGLIAAIAEQVNLLNRWEAELIKQNRMTPEIRGSIERFRQITENVKNVLVARDIFLHLAQDREHAAKLLEAVRAKNRAAIEEMLKRDVPGSSVVVQDAKEDNGVFLNLRIESFTHCFSTSAQCGGKQFSFTK